MRLHVQPVASGATVSDRVTIRDVAAAAHVHASTVSRVLSSPDLRVTPARQRVLDAVRRLGYRPNLLARALSSQRAPVVPLLVPDVANWFFAEVARGAEGAAAAAGFSLVLCNTESDPRREREYLESLAALQVPFAVVVPTDEASATAIRVFATHCPVVTLDRLIEGLGVPSATVDNRLGGRLATQHLLDLGHCRVACIAGPLTTSTGRARVQGYTQAMAANGREPVVIQGGFTTRDGVKAAGRFLDIEPRPTAVVAANDLCAIAFIHELEHRGLRVPADVSVVGFDDLEFAAYWRPSLTSIHQPARRLGALAVELALRALETGEAPQLRLRPRLVTRESTATAPCE